MIAPMLTANTPITSAKHAIVNILFFCVKGLIRFIYNDYWSLGPPLPIGAAVFLTMSDCVNESASNIDGMSNREG